MNSTRWCYSSSNFCWFVFPFLEFQMKFIPDIYATFFNKAIGLRVGFGIDKLKDLSIFNKFFSHQANVIFFIPSMVPNNFFHLWIQNIFTNMKKTPNIFAKFCIEAAVPKHINVFSVFNIEYFSFKQKWVDIFCYWNMNVKNKISIE